MFHCLVTGSHRLTGDEREWAERAIANRLRQFNPADTTLYSGDAWGVDYIAEKAAKNLDWFERRIWPAQWKVHGRKAGPIRNGVMLTALMNAGQVGDDGVVLAFLPKGHWSPGTLDMSKRVVKVGIRLEIWLPKTAVANNIINELDSAGVIDAGSVMLLTSY